MLLALVVGILFFFCINLPLIADPDLGWHLRNAQTLLHDHHFVRFDTYTYSLNGHAWINPEWLSEVFFYLAYQVSGIRGVEILSLVLLEALMLGVCRLAWLRVRSLRPALVSALLFIPFLSVTISPRTQLFGWLCLIAEFFLLQQFRAGRNYLWLLAPLFALWINLHGSWPIGIVFLVLFIGTGLISFRSGALEAWAWAPHQRTQLLLAAGFILPALFLNPYGWHLVLYPFQITGHHPLTLATVQEWQTLDFHSVRGRVIFVIIAATFVGRAARARMWTLYDVTALFVATLAGFTYSRFLLLTGIILCPMCAEEFGFLGSDKPETDKRGLNAAIIALLLFFMATHVPKSTELLQEQDKGYPAGAVRYLRGHQISGSLLNDFNWGGYLAWNLPQQPIFIDTRADVFEETGLFKTYLDITEIKAPIDSYHHGEFRYALFAKDAPISILLYQSPNWTAEYQDDTSVLFRRKP